MTATSFASEVSIVLGISIEERIDPSHCPLLLAQLLAIRGIHALLEGSLHSHRSGVGFVGTNATIVHLLENGAGNMRNLGELFDGIPVNRQVVFAKEPETVRVPGGLATATSRSVKDLM